MKIFVVDKGKDLLYRAGILYRVKFVTFNYRVEEISKAHQATGVVGDTIFRVIRQIVAWYGEKVHVPIEKK